MINLKRLSELFFSSRNSIKEFLFYLNYSLLISLLEKFDYSAQKRELSFKKVYLVDNSFTAFVPLRFSPDSGKLLENLVAIELQRRNIKSFYWKNRGDCDFIVLENDTSTLAIQVCFELNENNREREIAGIVAAQRHLRIQDAMIFTFNQTDNIMTNDVTIHVKPVFQWMLE